MKTYSQDSTFRIRALKRTIAYLDSQRDNVRFSEEVRQGYADDALKYKQELERLEK